MNGVTKYVDKEQYLEQLNNIMGTIVNTQEVLPDDNEETHNIQLEEEIR